MLSYKEARALVMKKYPNKRLDQEETTIHDAIDGWYGFSLVDKNTTDEEARWDNSLYLVNAETGEIKITGFLGF